MQESILPAEADAVFEGGGVKGIAFAGAIQVAEEHGVREWKNVAGTSAGAIAACLLAVGYHAADLEKILKVEYRDFADYGRAGKLGGFVSAFWRRGLAPGRFFETWMEEKIAGSPLAKELGKDRLTFGDVARKDLPDDAGDDDRRRALYRLRVIASDLTDRRMLVLPYDIRHLSWTRNGPPIVPDELSLAKGVRMSMSFPYFFTPVRLWKGNVPHDIVDGGLLSNFPVWLFDSARGARPTWGFRLHGGTGDVEASAPRSIRPPLWPFSMALAMFEATTEAWDREVADRTQSVRIVDIPTGSVSSMDFGLSSTTAQALYRSGNDRARRFFTSREVQAYLAQR